jgi:hypothetical protein
VAVEAVILDLSGTLVDEKNRAVPGSARLIADLQEAGIHVAVAATHDTAFGILQNAGLVPELVMTRRMVEAAKGNRAWVNRACATFGMQPHQVVWLGDSDLDMRSALNADVIFFNAAWSNPDFQYGIQVNSPSLFTALIREIFAKAHPWYWTCNCSDLADRSVLVRSAADANGAGNRTLARLLLNLLKDSRDTQLGPISVGEFARYHLLASMYGTGLVGGPHVVWTTYPGSTGARNPFLNSFADLASQLFRDRFVDDLLVRHTSATDMSRARTAGQSVSFLDQFNTVHLNPDHRQRIRGQRVVIVDDFVTEGYSFECARNLLLLAGAAEVVCVCVGRYGSRYTTFAPVDGYVWDPFSPKTHEVASFQERPCGSKRDQRALDEFLLSYRAFDAYSPF